MLMDSNNAIIAAILAEGAFVKERPMTVDQATINEALQGGYRLMSERSQNKDGSFYHKLWYEKPETTE
jgi:hypothetical protein